MNKKALLITAAAFSSSILFAVDYHWNSYGVDKNFNVAVNWNPQVAPSQAYSRLAAGSTLFNDFMVERLAQCGAAVINSDLMLVQGTINAGGNYGGDGVINILGGEIRCIRLQAGMRNNAGTVNIYGGAIQLDGIATHTDLTGALRAYYGGTINFFGGSVEMDYALWLSSDSTLNFYNAGAHKPAPNAMLAPIYAKKGVDTYALRVENGTLNVYLAAGLSIPLDGIIPLIEYNDAMVSPRFKNVADGGVLTVDGYRFRLEMRHHIEGTRYAVVLVALQPVDTSLQKGAVIMISKL